MKKLKKIIFVKILLLFLLTLFNSCSNNNIEKETIILAKTKISSLDITIGDNIISIIIVSGNGVPVWIKR
mgnify:CR=1 FL=1